MRRVVVLLGLLAGLALASGAGYALLGQLQGVRAEIEQFRMSISSLTARLIDQEQSYISQIRELERKVSSMNVTIGVLQQQKRALESQIEDLQRVIDIKDAKIAELDAQKKSAESEVASLTAERETLRSQIKFLTEERDRLQLQRDDLWSQTHSLITERQQLQLQISTLTAERDALQVKWDLWKRHSDLAPQSRSQYSVVGYFSSAGRYNIDQPSFIVSFPDPARCLYVSSPLATGSMKPAFDAGHTVVATTCFSQTDLRPGDIIIYRAPNGAQILHQILEVRPNGIITKGIHNETADPAIVSWSNIEALVIAIIF